jgi:hypothetical protein
MARGFLRPVLHGALEGLILLWLAYRFRNAPETLPLKFTQRWFLIGIALGLAVFELSHGIDWIFDQIWTVKVVWHLLVGNFAGEISGRL